MHEVNRLLVSLHVQGDRYEDPGYGIDNVRATLSYASPAASSRVSPLQTNHVLSYKQALYVHQIQQVIVMGIELLLLNGSHKCGQRYDEHQLEGYHVQMPLLSLHLPLLEVLLLNRSFCYSNCINIIKCDIRFF